MTIRVSKVRVKTRKVADLLQGEEIEAVLLAKAQAVADLAVSKGIRVEGVPGRIRIPVTATVTRGTKRSRARVTLDHPSGLAVESKHKLLASNIDAARDVP